MKRRAFLGAVLAGAAGYVFGRIRGAPSADSDLPERGNSVIARGNVSLPEGFSVPRGKTFRFDPVTDTTVECGANFLVEGVLEMHPHPGVTHTLRFVGLDETSFVGGGMDPIASDIGLWVMGAGRLDIRGTPKAGWNRTGDDPTWTDSDEILIGPHAAGDFTTFSPHPKGVAPPEVAGMPATEVFHLTRNANIEGTSEGRAHVFIRSTTPQSIRYATFRHMGPLKAGVEVLGRWPLHFHHAHEGSRGSVVEGCVVRDSGGHAYVAHMSHGVTFRDCVAYNVRGDAYWWDVTDDTNDTVYEHCLAANIWHDRRPEEILTTGFWMGRGSGNAARDCAALGIRGSLTEAPTSQSGFHWPSLANGTPSNWIADDLVAHHIRGHGTYVWQNKTPTEHAVNRFTAYRCAKSGILHGAYGNRFRFFDAHLHENGISQHAVNPGTETGQTGARVRAAEGQPCIQVPRHALDAVAPMLYEGCALDGGSYALDVADQALRLTKLDLVHCTRDGGDVEPSAIRVAPMKVGSVIRVQRRNGTAYQVDHRGVSRPIPAFA